MPSFKEMDPQAIWAILDATDEKGEKLHRDVLTPLAAQEDKLFTNSSCPKCGAAAGVPTLDTHRPFSPDSPLPRRLLRCVVCQTEYNPMTGLITAARIIDGST